jgi:hypothetical protein
MSDRPHRLHQNADSRVQRGESQSLFSSLLRVSVLSCQSAATMAPRLKLPRLRIPISGLGRSLMTRRARAGRLELLPGALAPLRSVEPLWPFHTMILLVVTRGPKTLEVASCL